MIMIDDYEHYDCNIINLKDNENVSKYMHTLYITNFKENG